MVDNILSFSTRGLRDWLFQRITAVVLLFYAVFILGFIVLHPMLQFDEWQGLFANNLVRIATLLALFSLIIHAWIGMWTVFTDYINCSYFRLALLVFVAILFFGCLAWGTLILWGN